MPGGDKTGPRGLGAMTGRGMGYCAGYNVPGYMNPGVNPRARGAFGFGRGMGMGMGRGNRWGFYATGQPGWARGYYPGGYFGPGYAASTTVSRADEMQYLKGQAEMLTKELEAIKSRIDELNAAESGRENK